MHPKNTRSSKKGSQKTFAEKRRINPAGARVAAKKRGQTPGFQEHDPKGRMGGFETAGEHARTGNRGR